MILLNFSKHFSCVSSDEGKFFHSSAMNLNNLNWNKSWVESWKLMIARISLHEIVRSHFEPPTDMSRSRVKIFISESRVTYDVEWMLNYLWICIRWNSFARSQSKALRFSESLSESQKCFCISFPILRRFYLFLFFIYRLLKPAINGSFIFW